MSEPQTPSGRALASNPVQVARPAPWSAEELGAITSRHSDHKGAEYLGCDTCIWLATLAEARAAVLDALEAAVRGISLPPGPDFAWVDGHKPFIAAVLETIQQRRQP